MKLDDLITELEQLAAQLGITIRYEKGDFEGGYCILKTERILLINKRLMPNKRASVCALALHEIGIDNLFIKPSVREFIEDEVARTLRTSQH